MDLVGCHTYTYTMEILSFCFSCMLLNWSGCQSGFSLDVVTALALSFFLGIVHGTYCC